MATSERHKTSARLLSPQGFLQLAADEVLRANRYHRPLSVALIQIDRLQESREEHGHNVAEAIFADSTARVIHGLRAPDRVSRLGPAELGVLMPETTLKQGQAAVERLVESVDETPVETSAGPMTIIMRAGMAGLSARNRDPKAFLMTAWLELRRAQSSGKPNISVAPPDLATVTISRSGQVH